jgi:hypothetical protein
VAKDLTVFTGRWLSVMALGAGILVVLAVALPVGDISRASSIAFPAVLIGVDWISREVRAQAAIISTVILVGNIASPILSITGTGNRYFYPAPMVLVEWARK